jgi:hypothetical protein
LVRTARTDWVSISIVSLNFFVLDHYFRATGRVGLQLVQLEQLGEVNSWLVGDDDRRWSSDNATDALALLSDLSDIM